MESIRFYRNLIDKVFPVTNCFKGRYFEDGVKMLLSKYTRKEISEIKQYAYQDISIFQNIGQAFKDEVMAGKPSKEQMKGCLDTALFELSQIGYGWKEHHYVGVIGSDKAIEDCVHKGLIEKDLIENVRDIACCVDMQTLRLLDSVEEIAEYIGYKFPKWWLGEDEDCDNNDILTEYQKECFTKLINADCDNFDKLTEYYKECFTKLINADDCFTKLINAGYMNKIGDGYRYEWKKTESLLAYTMEKIFCKNDTDKFPETMLNKMFGKDRLGKARTQLYNSSNPPRGAKGVDKVLL